MKRAALAILVAVAQPAHAANFEDAVTAFEAGDFGTALDLWRQLAELGDASALNNVGFMYEKGLGVRANPFTAADWYRAAAERGNTDAQVNLGVLHATGLGVPRDLVQAHKLFSQAAEAGNLKAKQDLSKIIRQMTAAEFATARANERETRPRTAETAKQIAAPAPPKAAPAVATTRGTAGWRVQVAALNARGDAEVESNRLRTQLRALAERKLRISKAELPTGTFYRVQIIDLKDSGDAQQLCDALQRERQPCFVVPPG